VEYQAKRITPSRGAEILRGQLGRLEEKAAHVNAMMGYIRAKLAWLDGGSKGPEPNFTDYEGKARTGARKRPEPDHKAMAIARRSFGKYANTYKTLAKS
jgi:hypothetical protein